MATCGWCAIHITDTGRLCSLAISERAQRGGECLIAQARTWIEQNRRENVDLGVSDVGWMQQVICHDMLTAVRRDRPDLLPPMGYALMCLTGFRFLVVEGTSDAVPISITEIVAGSVEGAEEVLRTFGARARLAPTDAQAYSERTATDAVAPMAYGGG